MCELLPSFQITIFQTFLVSPKKLTEPQSRTKSYRYESITTMSKNKCNTAWV